MAVLVVAPARGAHGAKTVATAPWFIDECHPGDFHNPPDGPWVIAALLPELAYHPRLSNGWGVTGHAKLQRTGRRKWQVF
ncbi:MAG: hypothetical protein OXG58_04135, partial [Gemmatimonadetes bacterium]|nr:hypothetical protein [Gemmatimonadota bacterium]MCY3943656.1 hypothetical protein [Gemmatimonadota bacterium]